MSIKFDDKIPIYIQIMDIIKKSIITGKLKGGSKLTSVRELSTMLNVNPNTIQRSYKELEREGLAYTQRGMGTFIVDNDKMLYKLKQDTANKVLRNFIKEMEQLGFNSNEILEIVSKILGEVE